MTTQIRIALFISVFLVTFYILRNIRKNRLVISDAVFWFVFAVVLLILAVFPELAYSLSNAFGFKSSINLVFLVIIALLLFRLFQVDLTMSRAEKKLEQLERVLDEEKKVNIKE